MSKLLCVLLVLQALLAGYHQLAVAASAQIGDEFLCQDPIQRPIGLMLSHAGNDEFNGDSAATPPHFTREEAVIDEEAFFSGDEYTGEDEDEEIADGDPDRSADEEIAGGEENSMLGGHGAIAAEASNDLEELGSSSGGDVECPECGKLFRNNKSMFGHLKSHPDRGYKGATPPRVRPKLLMPSRPSPVNDCPAARYSQRDPNLNAFEMLAGYIMLTLKHRDSRIAQENQSVNVEIEPDVPPEEEGSIVSKTRDGVALGDRHGSSATAIAEDDMVSRSDGGSTAELTVDEPVHRSEHGSTAVEAPTTVEAPTKRERVKKSKEARRVRRKEKDVVSAGKARRPYICKHCNAVFPTHQALGGHMAAHNKDRRVQAQNVQAAAAALEARPLNRQDGEEERGQGGMSASTRELLMERYTRMFNQGWQSRQEETGERYKRQHTERMDGCTPPPVALPVADGDGRMLFGVDLNARAPPKQE